jgi:hypothetical protein
VPFSFCPAPGPRMARANPAPSCRCPDSIRQHVIHCIPESPPAAPVAVTRRSCSDAMAGSLPAPGIPRFAAGRQRHLVTTAAKLQLWVKLVVASTGRCASRFSAHINCGGMGQVVLSQKRNSASDAVPGRFYICRLLNSRGNTK